MESSGSFPVIVSLALVYSVTQVHPVKICSTGMRSQEKERGKGKKDSRQLFKMKISCPAKYSRKKLDPILHELLTSMDEDQNNSIEIVLV